MSPRGESGSTARALKEEEFATLRGNNLLRYCEIWQKFSNEVSLRAQNQQHKQMNEQVNEWMNEWTSERASQPSSEQENKWTIENLLSAWRSFNTLVDLLARLIEFTLQGPRLEGPASALKRAQVGFHVEQNVHSVEISYRIRMLYNRLHKMSCSERFDRNFEA